MVHVNEAYTAQQLCRGYEIDYREVLFAPEQVLHR